MAEQERVLDWGRQSWREQFGRLAERPGRGRAASRRLAGWGIEGWLGEEVDSRVGP